MQKSINNNNCFISSKGANDKEQVKYSYSDNMEIMISDEAYEVMEKHFKSLLNKYQKILQILIEGSEFVFHCVHLLYYKYHRINPTRTGSLIDSPD